MAERLGDVWQRALDANVRYYEAWGRVATDYVRELSTALKGFSPRMQLPTITLPNITLPVTSAATGAASRPQPTGSETPTPGAPNPAVVLEAAPGSSAQGAVLVENHLSHPVSAPIEAQVDGEIHILIEPDRVDLAPGESVVVRVSATIPHDESSAPLEIRGELRVPELVGTVVPLLIRSRSGPAGRPSPEGG
jgi:hypothetical protein